MIERSMIITARRDEWCAYCGATRSERCPSCANPEVLPIVFGMPGPELFSVEQRGDVALGGCVVRPVDVVCVRCGHEWIRGTSPFSTEFVARTAHAEDGIVGVAHEMADRLGEFVPVLDRETLDAVLESCEAASDNDDASATRSGVDRYVDVVCSLECRDRLLLEGQGAAVSVWRRDENGDVRWIAGTGPFRHMPSAVIVVGDGIETPVVAVSSMLDDRTISGLEAVDDPTGLWDRVAGEVPLTDLSEIGWLPDLDVELRSECEPDGAGPRVERHFVEVEMTVEGSVVSIAVIPTDRDRPRRVTFKDEDVTVEALARRLEPVGCRIMSVPRSARLIERGLIEVALAAEKTSVPRCLHPRLERGRCYLCARDYRVESVGGGTTYPLRPVYVLRRGLGQWYRWSEHPTRTSQGSGAWHLDRMLAMSEVTPPVAPTPKIRPMVAGYTPAHGVILFEDEARPLAELYDVVRAPCAVSELLGVASALGISWMRDALDEWIDTEDDVDEVRVAAGQYRPDAVVHIDHDFWHGEEGYGPWPNPDDPELGEGPAIEAASALGMDQEEFEETFDVESAADWIRYRDLEAVVEALEEAGVPIRFDNDLIQRAAAEY